MNRNEEYLTLRGELESTPAALEYSLARAEAKYKRNKKRGYLFGVPATCILALCAAFVLLVNVSTTFAMACDKIPVIRELAEAVKFSPSLKAAVENDYVQRIDRTRTSEGITMTVEYVIVDSKQVNIFYSLESELYENLFATPIIRAANSSASTYCHWSMSEYGTLHCVTVGFTDEVPDALQFICDVADYSDAPFDREPDALVTFNFLLEFNPAYTKTGKAVTVNRGFEIDGQRFTVTTVEIYPTHVRVNVEGDEANTAWLKGLNLYLEDENGQIYGEITNGVTSSGDPDSPAMASFRLNSPYFAECKSLSLHILGATWLDKSMERIEINLAETAASVLPAGVSLISTMKTDEGWNLVFEGTFREKDHYFNLFSNPCDENGVAYKETNWMISDKYEDGAGGIYGRENHFYEVFTIAGCTADTVWLTPSYSRWYDAPEPIVLTVK